MDRLLIDVVTQFGAPITLVVIAFFTGRYLEHSHFEDIRRREAANRDFLTVNSAHTPTDEPVEMVGLVMGSVATRVVRDATRSLLIVPTGTTPTQF